MLPEIKKVKQLDVFTPAIWQTVILRNYGIVSTVRIAHVLGTDKDVIEFEAKRLGIEKIIYNKKWEKQGYITIIRNNWYLLPYNQLASLLGFTIEYLDFILKEDDFLGIKLGSFKPYCEEVKYTSLTKEQIEETDKIRDTIKKYFIENYASPFDFYRGQIKENDNSDGFDRIVYNYNMLYGDTLLDGGDIISDEQLKRLQSVGVNGIWLQGVLSKLSFYPFVKNLSDGYEKRRDNLNKLIARCRKFGIGIFVYFNEPRALPKEQFDDDIIKLRGREYNGEWALCTEKKEVQNYLYNAVKDFATSVPDLEGVITITMSENLTNCFARPDNDCPTCGKKKIYDVVPNVNNIIYKALQDGNHKTRLIANLWGWNEDFGWSFEDIIKGIDNLDKGIEILCVSEFGTVMIDGKPTKVDEYSLSRVGPCLEAQRSLQYAKENGHKILAKVQVNNSWEFPSIPFIPVFRKVEEHLTNLKQFGLSGLMMSWTLGGYPSASLSLAKQIFSKDYDYDKWLKNTYGENYQVVKESVDIFSNAFSLFPYSQEFLYSGVHYIGPANLWYKERTDLKATMSNYPFDDVESWRGRYSLTDFIDALNKLTGLWEQGIIKLQNITGNEEFSMLKRYAEVIHCNLLCVINQIEYITYRDKQEKNQIKCALKKEKELTKLLYVLSSQDSRVGYEASNHYFFTQNSFLEKFINIEKIESNFK